MAFRHGKNTVVLIKEFDLSSYFNDATTSASVETAETTTYGVANGSKTYVTGHNDGTVSLSGLFEGAAGGVDQVLTSVIGSSTDVNFTIANDGGMAVGRRCTIGQSIETSYEVNSPVADVVSVSAELQPDGGIQRGVILAPLSVVSATGNGTSVDNGAATTNGGTAMLHVPANTRNGNITIKVQHSADNSTWADLTTFAVVSSTVKTSERLVVASGTTVNRYLRASYTVAGSSGSATIAVAFARRY